MGASILASRDGDDRAGVDLMRVAHALRRPQSGDLKPGEGALILTAQAGRIQAAAKRWPWLQAGGKTEGRWKAALKAELDRQIKTVIRRYGGARPFKVMALATALGKVRRRLTNDTQRGRVGGFVKCAEIIGSGTGAIGRQLGFEYACKTWASGMTADLVKASLAANEVKPGEGDVLAALAQETATAVLEYAPADTTVKAIKADLDKKLKQVKKGMGIAVPLIGLALAFALLQGRRR